MDHERFNDVNIHDQQVVHQPVLSNMVGANNQLLQNDSSLQIVLNNGNVAYDDNRANVWCQSRIMNELENFQPFHDPEKDKMKKAILDFFKVKPRESDETLERLCAVVRKIRGNPENAEFVQYYLIDALRLLFLSNVQAKRNNLHEAHENIKIFKHIFTYLQKFLEFETYANIEIEKDHVKFMNTLIAITGVELRKIIRGELDRHTQNITQQTEQFVCSDYTFGRNEQVNYARVRTFTMIINILHAPGSYVLLKQDPFEFPMEMFQIQKFALFEFRNCMHNVVISQENRETAAQENGPCYTIQPNRNITHLNGYPSTMNPKTELHQDNNHCSKKRGPSYCVPESEKKKIKANQSDQQGASHSLNEIPSNEHDNVDQANENIANQQAEVRREIKAEPDVDLNNRQAENPDEMQEQLNDPGANGLRRAAQVKNEHIANPAAEVNQDNGPNEQVNDLTQNATSNQCIHALLETVGTEAAWTPPNNQEYEQARTKPPVDKNELSQRINTFLEEMNNGLLPSTIPITEIMGSEIFDEQDMFEIYNLLYYIAVELEDRIEEMSGENNEDALSAYKAACLIIVNSFAPVTVTCVNEELEAFYRKFIRVTITIMRYRVNRNNNDKEKADAVAKHFRLVNMGTSYSEMCCFHFVYRYLCESDMTFEDGVNQEQNRELMDEPTEHLYNMSLGFHKSVNKVG